MTSLPTSALEWLRLIEDTLSQIPREEWLPILARMEEAAVEQDDRGKVEAIEAYRRKLISSS